MKIFEYTMMKSYRGSSILSQNKYGVYLFGWKIMGLNGFNGGMYLFDQDKWGERLPDPQDEMPYEWLIIVMMAEEHME